MTHSSLPPVCWLPTTARARLELIAHLAEIDLRKLYRPAGYPAMYLYCVHEFHMSEGVAYRRVRAARVVRHFPAVLAAIADGRLHLDAVKLLAKHFRPRNVDALIAAATHRTSREVATLIAERFPSPDVPTTIRPLLPERGAPAACDGSNATPVEPGEVQQMSELAALRVYATVLHESEAAPEPAPAAGPPPRVDPTSPGRFALQVTLDQRTHDLLRRAQDLLSPAANGHDVAQVLARALDDLVRTLEHEKFATTESPRARRSQANGRYVPAEVKRQVAERDGRQCAFVGHTGRRCSERSDLEIDHIVPLARGGLTVLENLRLLCAAHNQYEAERVYGEGFMEAKRAAAAHAHDGVRERAPNYSPRGQFTTRGPLDGRNIDSPRARSTGPGGAFMRGLRASRIVCLFALLASGAHAAWQPGGNPVAALTTAQFNPRGAADGRGGSFVCYEGSIGPFGPNLQRLNGDGLPADGWSTDSKLTVYDPAMHGVSRPARVLSDGTGGCYLIWLQEAEDCTHSCLHEPGRNSHAAPGSRRQADEGLARRRHRRLPATRLSCTRV